MVVNKSVRLIGPLICLLLASNQCSAEDIQSFRLTGNSRPSHYNLALKIDVDEQVFSGSVDISLEVVQTTAVIDLHYRDMEVSNIQLTDNNQLFPLMGQGYLTETEILSLRYVELPPGAYKLSMDFSSKIRTDLKGLYMSTYFDAEGTKRYIATTFMAPTYARMAFPCYDEPEYKANYTISITHMDKYFALSNMPAEEPVTNLGNGWQTTKFMESKPTSTYIVAFIVCDFVHVKHAEWPLSIYAQPAVIKDTSYALDHFNGVRAKLEEYVGRSFQYPKLDMIAIDDFLMGAMENWGLITYLSSRVLVNDATDLKTKISNSKTMSHEMAHQWFGNEVTHQYWNVVWLKEGLATLFEDLLTDAVHPEWRMWDQFVINTMQFVMQQDCVQNVRSMMKEYNTPAEIRAVYDFVTYKKAGSVMRMMMNVLTETVFKKSIDYYIEDNSFATATNVKLAAAWQKAVDSSNAKLPNIATIFDSWTNNGGFPVVHITRSRNNNFTLRQERFVSSHLRSGEGFTGFHIPLNYATQNNPDFSNTSPVLWLTEKEIELELNEVGNQWFIFNKQATGYYRVNYDDTNWRLISKSLKENLSQVAPSNRAQLIDDALNLAKYGHMDYEVALSLVDYVEKEEDFVPLTSAFTNLKDLERLTRGSDLSLELHFVSLISKLYNKFNLENIPENESDVDRLARIEIVSFACRYGVLDCTRVAFLKLTENVTGEITADYRPAVFCGAVQYLYSISDGNVASVILYYRHSLKSAKEGDRRRNDKEINEIFSAFSCIRNEVVLEEVLSWTLNGREGVYFDKGDALRIFTAVANANVTGTTIAMDFLFNNYEEMEANYDSFPKVFEALARNIVTLPLKAQFDNIVNTYVGLNAINTALRNAIDNANDLITENLLWKELRLDSVKRFIRGSAVRPIAAPLVLSLSLLTILKAL